MEPLTSQTMPPSRELPSIEPSVSSSFLKTKLPWIINIILLLVIISGGYFFLSVKNQPVPKTPLSISPTPPNQIINKTPTIIPTQNPTLFSTITQNWKTQIIDLYGLSLSLPVDWTIKEVNRRPEPTRPFDPIKGHDCVDYLITSSDGFTQLSLKPSCGFDEWFPEPLLPGTITVKELTNDQYIYRYYDTEKSMYKYAEGGKTTYEDVTGTHSEITQVGGLSYGRDDNLVFLRAELVYSGQDVKKDQSLQTADRIISSITKQ